MLGFSLRDGWGSKTPVRVTKAGQLVVAPVAYDDAMFNSLDTVDTAFTFFGPRSGKQFVITSIVVFGTKEINDASDTNVIIYEGNTPTTITVDKTLLRFGVGKLTTLPIVPLNLIVNTGKFINAKTDDNTIEMTIMGNYVDEL